MPPSESVNASSSPEEDLRRKHFARLLAPPGLNGGKEAWVDYYAPLIVNPIGEPEGQTKMTPKEVSAAIEQGRLIQAIQTYSLLHEATSGLPDRDTAMGFEVLARIMRPKKTPAIATPRFFLSGLTPGQRKKLTTESIAFAANIAKEMDDAGYRRFTAAGVNATEEFLESEDMGDLVLQAAEEAGIPPSSLELEILESIAHLSSEALQAMRLLHDEHGVKFVLDDFDPGAEFNEDIRGRCNRSRELLEELLKVDFPIDGIKVPGECVCGVSTPNDSLRREDAVRSVLDAAKALQVRRVIFEGGPAGVSRADADRIVDITRSYHWAEKHLWFEGSLMAQRQKRSKVQQGTPQT